MQMQAHRDVTLHLGQQRAILDPASWGPEQPVDAKKAPAQLNAALSSLSLQRSSLQIHGKLGQEEKLD